MTVAERDLIAITKFLVIESAYANVFGKAIVIVYSQPQLNSVYRVLGRSRVTRVMGQVFRWVTLVVVIENDPHCQLCWACPGRAIGSVAVRAAWLYGD